MEFENRKINIFQDNKFIRKTIAESLGYEGVQEYSWFTQDIYFQTYFYLTKRFGFPQIIDDYKKISVWNFIVKQYSITIEMNSSWVIFMVFGDKKKFRESILPPSWIKYNRIQELKQSSLIINLEDAEKRSSLEKENLQKLFDEFQKENKIPDDITNEEFDEKYGYDFWFTKINEFNNSVIGLNHEEFREKYGDTYYNSNTKHALKTLRQFLYNMQTPIWIRDAPFNIKGDMTDEEAFKWSRFENNIPIQFVNI